MPRRSTVPAPAAQPQSHPPAQHGPFRPPVPCPPPSEEDVAYSYLRFSSLPQEAGDSIRRQDTGARQWANRNRKALDTSLKIDRGVQAFKGQNRTIGALGEFLRMVDAGRVRPGSYLVVESLDRLTREEVFEALYLLLGIMRQGIRIVQLMPSEVVYQQGCDALVLMWMIMELQRGHGESKVKSERVGGAWAEKRRRAREGEEQKATARMGKDCRVMTARLPAWCHLERGRAVLVPERVAAVRRAFALLAAGYGYTRALARLNADGVPALGPSGRWTRSFLTKLLRDRRLLGEMQPTCQRRPDGPPIPGYYPAALTEREYGAALAARSDRGGGRPARRVGRRVNLLPGLLTDARTGHAYTPVPKGGGRVVLLVAASRDGDGPCRSLPLDVFERALFGRLQELRPEDVLGSASQDRTAELTTRLAAVRSSLALLSADMDEHGESPGLLDRYRRKEAEATALEGQLREESRRAAHPLALTWQEAQGLLGAYDAAQDRTDFRLRLRAAFARMIEGVWLLVVPRGKDRLAAVQVVFAGGERWRSYLIYSRTAGNGRTAELQVRALAAGATDDLRDRAAALDMATALASMPLAVQ